MNTLLSIRLDTTSEQNERLRQLQEAFAAVCNTLAPLVQRSHCWNRVALHHLAYRQLREQFPALGSQMICNALYSVSRVSRLVYQHPQSPFNAQRLAGRALPCLQFLPQSPVYFDRHTLSLKKGQASMYTLDGRMRFNLPLAPEDEMRFRTAKLREIVLRREDAGFSLSFSFADPDLPADGANADAAEAAITAAGLSELPQYLLVMQEPAVAGPPQDPHPIDADAAAEREPSLGHDPVRGPFATVDRAPVRAIPFETALPMSTTRKSA